MDKMAPHLPNPACVRHRTYSRSAQAHQCDPFELFRPMQHNGNNVLCQPEERHEAVFNSGERGALGGRVHGLGQLLGC